MVALSHVGVYDWEATFGGPGLDRLTAILVDDDLVVVVGAYENAIDIPSVPPATGMHDALVAAYTTSGAALWTLTTNTAGCDALNHLEASGDEIIVGGGYGGMLALPGVTHTSTGGLDALILRVSRDGSVRSAEVFGAGGDDGVTGTAHGVRAGVVGGTFDCRNVSLSTGTGFIQRL
jgi:hypothetical protein